MHPNTIHEALKAIGLPGAALGEAFTIPSPASDPVARGFVRRAAPVDVSDWDVLDVNVPDARRAGFSLHWTTHEPRQMLVSPCEPGRTFRVLPPNAPGVVATDDELWLDPATLPPLLAVLLDDDTGLTFQPSPETGLVAHPLIVDPLPIPDALDVPRHVTSWLQSVPDPWLDDLVQEALAFDDGWSTLIATGRFVRLREPTDDELAAIRSGTPNDTSAREREWVRSLPAQTLESALIHLQTAAEHLHDTLEEVANSVAPDNPTWRQSFLDVLHTRDDLEGLALILTAAGSGERVKMALSALDAAGETWIRALPTLPELADDERLSRASVVSPLGWWTEPVDW